MLIFYKRRADYILKKAHLKGYNPKTAKMNFIGPIVFDIFWISGCFALATSDRLLGEPLFWLWIAGLFALSGLATLALILSGSSVASNVLTLLTFLGSGALFINAFPQKDTLISDPNIMWLFFITFVASGMVLINCFDYFIVRKNMEPPTTQLRRS